MSYSNNPLLPKARSWAVNLVVKEGLPPSVAARRAGVHRTTLWRWLKRWQELGYTGYVKPLPTNSSRPHSHPKQLKKAVVERIVALRHELQRCAETIWYVLKREGVRVSLASVGRVLSRAGLTSSWYGAPGKQRRKRIPRPHIKQPGDLVQLDAIHFVDWHTRKRCYVYTLIDLKSRWAFAAYSPRLGPDLSWYFVTAAWKAAGFPFTVIQTDNGSEFGNQFEGHLTRAGITQRRIRLGRKNDNAHIERFNRTIQDECLGRWPDPGGIPDKLQDYLVFYNTKRLHLGIQGRTPAEMLRRF